MSFELGVMMLILVGFMTTVIILDLKSKPKDYWSKQFKVSVTKK